MPCKKARLKYCTIPKYKPFLWCYNQRCDIYPVGQIARSPSRSWEGLCEVIVDCEATTALTRSEAPLSRLLIVTVRRNVNTFACRRCERDLKKMLLDVDAALLLFSTFAIVFFFFLFVCFRACMSSMQIDF